MTTSFEGSAREKAAALKTPLHLDLNTNHQIHVLRPGCTAQANRLRLKRCLKLP
jgi:hypothetical protein